MPLGPSSRRRSWGLGLALLVAVPAAAQDAAPPGPHAFLVEAFALTARDLATLDQGRAVVKTLEPGDRREVALAGIVRIAAPRERMVDGWRDIVSFRKSEHVPEIATFSTPPRREDLAGLALDRQDLDDLIRCRPGSCKVQLSAADIERFGREVDWRAPSRTVEATAVWHAVLIDRLRAYQAGGIEALGAYADRGDPVDVGDQLRSALGQSPSPLALVPELRPYLLEFPRRALAGTEDLFYWSKEKFGFKPVTGLTHATIYVQPGRGGVAVLVSRQIYANHYFDASVGISALIDVPGREGETFDLLYVNRTRSARVTGFFGPIARSMATGRARDSMVRLLEALKRRTEGGVSANTGR